MNKWILILSCLYSFTAIASTNAVDSLKQRLLTSDSDTQTLRILNSIGKEYENAGNDSALIYYTQAKELSRKLGEKFYEGLSVQNLGVFYLNTPSFDTAMSHHVKALEIFSDLNDSIKIAEQYTNIASSLNSGSQYEKALNYNLKAIEIYEQMGKFDKAIVQRSTLYPIYMSLGESDKAIKCLNDLLEYEPREEVKEHIAAAYNNIGFIYFQLNELLVAMEYFNKALEYSKEIGRIWEHALAHGLKGKVYMVLGDLDIAEEYILKAKNMFAEMGDRTYLNKVNINLSELYNAKGDFDKAAYYAEETIEVSREIGILWMENLAQYTLANAHFMRGNYKKAYEAHQAHKWVNDKVQAEIKTKQIADIHIKYETERIEQENALLRLDNEQQRLALFQQRKFRNILLGFIIVILFFALILLNRYQLKRKINKELVEKNDLILKQQKELELALDQLQEFNEELEQQKEEIETQAEILEEANATKDKFFSIIAHDLKTPFNSILGLSDLMLQNYNRSDDAKRKTFVQSIRDAAATTYELLTNLLIWARSQSNRIEINKEELNLAELIKLSIQPYMKNAEAKQLLVNNSINNGKIVNGDKYTLSTVFGNLFSNAVKFTESGGSITIEAQKSDGHIDIAMTDTGVGISETDIQKLFKIAENYSTPGTQNESGTGLGLILCKEFVEKNNGELIVESRKGKGTTFTVKIPTD